jgi:lipoyl(octanoyl) transferase
VKWSVVNTGENTGVYNMEYDMNLAENIREDEAMLRLYTWKPYCISLGANQDESVVDLDKCRTEGIDIVKRPTGGRAILHAEEVTYSVVMHCSHENSPQKIYKEINDALLSALGLYDKKLTSAELEYKQPDYAAIYRAGKGVACFAETAKNELKFEHKKLIGSAQRKMGSVVLQHGSILCGSFHRRLPFFLNISSDEQAAMLNELRERTTEIESILNTAVDYERLKESIISGFEEYFGEKLNRLAPVELQTILN